MTSATPIVNKQRSKTRQIGDADVDDDDDDVDDYDDDNVDDDDDDADNDSFCNSETHCLKLSCVPRICECFMNLDSRSIANSMTKTFF